MSKAIELTTDNFDTTIGTGVALVDFWAEWCGPCRMMTPILDELVDDYQDKATIAKVNVDTAGDIAQKFGVASIPTLIIFKDGQESTRFVGVTAKKQLVSALDGASA